MKLISKIIAIAIMAYGFSVSAMTKDECHKATGKWLDGGGGGKGSCIFDITPAIVKSKPQTEAGNITPEQCKALGGTINENGKLCWVVSQKIANNNLPKDLTKTGPQKPSPTNPAPPRMTKLCPGSPNCPPPVDGETKLNAKQ